MSENKTVQNFKRPKFYSTVKPRWYAWIKKGLEMAGIVKAITKELEPEDPFKILVVDFELQSSYVEQPLGETLLEMRICSTEFVLFSRRYICKHLRAQKKLYFWHIFPV